MEQGTADDVDQKSSSKKDGSLVTTGDVNPKPRQRSRRKLNDVEDDPSKRRCVSTACIACRKRKSKCDGNIPACAACLQVYGTECIYDPNSDHRRKGVYKNDIDNFKTRNTTLQTIIQAILNYQEDEAFELVREIRTCDSLDAVAERIVAQEHGLGLQDENDDTIVTDSGVSQTSAFDAQMYARMGDLRLDEGTVRYIGGTSNLIHVNQEEDVDEVDEYPQHENPLTSWTNVTDDTELVIHLLNMYFTWHYTYFTTLSKTLFYRDFLLGRPPPNTKRKTHYCTPLLVNAMLALGCHFTSHRGAREDPDDSATAGDHFFREAKRLMMENDEHEKPRLTNVQALALMSVREAGCGREAKGWVYSGMSFRMACDMGLNLNSGRLTKNKNVNGDEAEEDVRRITFWGCFLFDKCWSNYMGRLPQLPTSIITVPKFEVFPDEDSSSWTPYTDSGFSQAHSQPSRTRAVALQISKLCEISNDLMNYFYNPTDMEKNRGKSAELKMLSGVHTRLEAWRRDLPQELEPHEGGLSSVFVMHMFYQLLFIHLFRPFLRYTHATSPLPQTVSPRKLCTQAAQMISKLMRLYKRSHGLRQIPNIAVYIAHAACTIHMINLPDKNAKRDIIHGVKHLEEIAEGWLCARRTLSILSVLAKKWRVELPEEAAAVLVRTDSKFASFARDVHSPAAQSRRSEAKMGASQYFPQQPWQNGTTNPSTSNAANTTTPIVSASTSQSVPALQSAGSNSRIPSPNTDGRSRQYSGTTSPQSIAQLSMDAQKTASSGDVFGGVEQLIHDSQDWAIKESMAFNAGFENWTDIDMYPSNWTNGLVGDGAMMGTTTNGTPSPGMPIASMQPPVYGMDGNTAMNGYPIMNWGTAMNNYDHLATYNEEDWYQ